MSTPAISATAPALVGRERELEALDAGVRSLNQGNGSLFLIVGPAGIGKTMLATEAARQARELGADVYWGRAWAGAGAPPFWPWTQVLRGLLADLSPDERQRCFEPNSAELSHIVEPAAFAATDDGRLMASDQRQFRLFDAVARFAGSATKTRRLVVVLDDLHDADASSVQLLRFIARVLPVLPVMVVATYRDLEARETEHAQQFSALVREGRTLSLPPFDGSAVERVAAASGLEMTRECVDAVVRMSAGVPYFVDAIVRGAARRVADDGVLRLDVDDLSIPAEAEDAALFAFSRLGAASIALLGEAAVIGMEFDAEALVSLSGGSPDEVVASLENARRLGALVPIDSVPGRWRFAHAILRDSLYRRMPIADRSRLHEAMAEVLRGDVERRGSGAAEVAAHLLLAPAGSEASSVADWCLRAAREAEARHANDEAVAWHTRALELAERHALQAFVPLALEGLARTRERSGDLAGARAAYLRMHEEAVSRGDRVGRARAALGSAGPPLLPVGTEVPTTRASSADQLRDALQALAVEEPGLRAMLHARLAIEIYEHDASAERAMGFSAMALQAAEECGDSQALAYCLALRHVIVWGRVPASERMALIDRLAELAVQQGDVDLAARVRPWRVSCYFELGDLAGVERELRDWRDRSQRYPHPLDAWHIPLFEAGLALWKGSFADAERRAQQAMRDGYRFVELDAVYANGVQQFFLRRELGTLARHRSLLRGLAASQATSGVVRTLLAFLYSELGEREAAADEFERLAANDFAAVRKNSLWLAQACLLAEVCVALGDRERARFLFEELRPYRDAYAILGAVFCGSVAYYLGRLAHLLGRQEEAVVMSRLACERHDTLAASAWLVRSWRVLADVDPNGDADGLRGRADRLAESLGMPVASAGGATSPPVPPASREAVATVARFARRGEGWQIDFDGKQILLPALKGCEHIEYLLERPEIDVPATDLLAAASGPADGSAVDDVASAAVIGDGMHIGGLGDAGPRLDSLARRAYQSRLAELREDLREAEANNDFFRAERAREEIDFLSRELSAAFGIGGRPRPEKAEAERARLTVTKRIKAAISKIEEHHKPLARFLSDSVRTGVFCRYSPPPGSAPLWHFA